ncbi:DUF6441 family protein [Roseomonas mucosa]|uniref:DUF6441 family protein n=1 Tax=Roseomonas mucosa TaxID=207340 RepID=UPI00384A97C4
MSAQLSLTVEAPDPQQEADLRARLLAKAMTATMREASVGLKGSLRAQISAAGMGTRLGNAVRDKAYPDRTGAYSPKAVAEVRANRNAGAILRSFSQGATIVPGSGQRALAIPTARVPTDRYGRKLSPAEAKLRFGERLVVIPGKARNGTRILKSANAALALTEAVVTKRGLRRGRAGRRSKITILYWLVPSAQIPRKLNPEEAAAQWTAQLPRLLGLALERLSPAP